MKQTILAALTVALLVLGPRPAPAQQGSMAGPKPLVTIAFSGYDELLKDIEFVGNLSGNPQLKAMVEGSIQQSPAGPVLAGVDATRPWGFVVQTDAEKFPLFAFVPVTDFKKLLTALEPMVGGANDAGGGVWEIQVQNQMLYLKENPAGWVFIARNPDVLASTPADPIKALGGLHEKYDLAVRVSVANLPPALRQMAIGFVQMGLQSGMQRLPNETDQQHAMRMKAGQQAITQIQTLLNELDTFLLGFAIDRASSSAYLESVVTALPDTSLAKQYAEATGGPTDFSGFILPDAAVTVNAVSKISQQDIDRAKIQLAQIRTNTTGELEQQGLSGADLDRAKKLVGELFDVAESVLEGGRIDAGLSLVLGPDTLTYVSGVKVGDTAKLDSLIKDFAKEVIQSDPGIADAIKMNAGEHEGVKLHVISLPTAEMAAQLPNLPKLVGDTLDAVIGIGPENAYVAVGRNAMDTLTKAIDQSKATAGKSVPPFRMSLAATSIANFVALVARDDQVKQTAAMVAQMLSGAGQKDHLTVTSTPVPNGAKIRVEFEEGLLKVLGAAPMMMGGPGR